MSLINIKLKKYNTDSLDCKKIRLNNIKFPITLL